MILLQFARAAFQPVMGKKMRIGLKAILALGFATNIGVAVADESCDSVLRISKRMSYTSSDENVLEQHAQAFCNEYDRADKTQQSSGYKAAYKALSGSAERGKLSEADVHSKYCSSSDGTTARSNAFRTYAEALDPAAYEAYTQCLKMKESDVVFDVDTNSILADELVLDVSFRPRNRDEYADLVAQGSRGVDCRWNVASESPGALRLARTTTAVLRCSRADRSKPGFVRVDRLDVANPPHLALPFEAYRGDTPVRDLENLQSALSELSTEVSDLQTETNRKRVESGKIDMAADGTPPLMEPVPNACSGPNFRGTLHGHQAFNPPFASRPKVSIGLSSMDIASGGIRLHVDASNITENGFDYNFSTFCDTKIASAVAEWIAVGM